NSSRRVDQPLAVVDDRELDSPSRGSLAKRLPRRRDLVPAAAGWIRRLREGETGRQPRSCGGGRSPVRPSPGPALLTEKALPKLFSQPILSAKSNSSLHPERGP